MTRKLSPKFDEALAFVSHEHRDQVRKGSGTPYVAHLLSVAAIVLEHGGTELEAIAALLHDYIEDQADKLPGGALEAREIVVDKFGEEVARIVDACTDATTSPKPPWRPRKEAYLAHLREQDSASVLLVSMSDKLHNARSIVDDHAEVGEELWSRFTGDRDGTLWYYRELLAAYGDRGHVGLRRKLAQVVDAMQSLGR